jgi:Rrf2 family transcriptional regulator, iron-sulfur cluster assembly transcription factor
MRLTTKGRYAVTAVLDLAFHQQSGPVSLADISKRQGISLSYLEQLFSRLRRNSVVTSTRGPGGGYSLARAEDEISMAQIIVAVDESYDATNCGGEGSCTPDNFQCLTHDLWQELSEEIHQFLNGITLAEMKTRNDVVDVAKRQEGIFESTQSEDVAVSVD